MKQEMDQKIPHLELFKTQREPARLGLHGRLLGLRLGRLHPLALVLHEATDAWALARLLEAAVVDRRGVQPAAAGGPPSAARDISNNMH